MLAVLNAILSFFLEMAALLALGLWGFRSASPNSSLAWVFALAIPILFIWAWSYWAAPRSKHRLKGWKYAAYKFAVLSIAFYTLVPLGQPQAAFRLEALLILNLLLPSLEYSSI